MPLSLPRESMQMLTRYFNSPTPNPQFATIRRASATSATSFGGTIVVDVAISSVTGTPAMLFPSTKRPDSTPALPLPEHATTALKSSSHGTAELAAAIQAAPRPWLVLQR